jgi:glycosyltransferase involved in cell wall biosynthesis
VKKILFYNPAPKQGHHLDHLSIILNELKIHKGSLCAKYYFVLNVDMKPFVLSFLEGFENNYIEFEFLEKKYTNKIPHPKSILSSFKSCNHEINFLNNFIKSNGINKICFLMLDGYELIIGSSKFIKTNIKVAGVYFHTPTRMVYSPFNRLFENSRLFFKRVIKEIFLYYMLKNKNIENVFILQDEKARHELNKKYDTTIFKFIPEAYQHFKSSFEFMDIRKLYNISKHSYIFLVFGALGPGKNVINIIGAFDNFCIKLPASDAVLLIAGKFSDKNYEKKVFSLIESSSIEVKNKTIINPNYLEDIERDSLINVCNSILIPYLNFGSSSNMLLNSNINKKKLIASNYGLVAEIVKENNLGYVVNPNSKDDIASKMETLYIDRNMEYDGEKFYSEENVHIFSKLLIEVQ